MTRAVMLNFDNLRIICIAFAFTFPLALRLRETLVGNCCAAPSFELTHFPRRLCRCAGIPRIDMAAKRTAGLVPIGSRCCVRRSTWVSRRTPFTINANNGHA
jgi:hypothetical protein